MGTDLIPVSPEPPMFGPPASEPPPAAFLQHCSSLAGSAIFNGPPSGAPTHRDWGGEGRLLLLSLLK